MSIEDNDNYYILDEEKDEELHDDSPRNFAAYDIDEEENINEEESAGSNKEVSPFGLMFKIMFSPVEGWKKLRRSGIKIESIQSGCFYPLLALLALSKFSEFFYSVNVSLSQVVTQAVIAFVAYFFSYFCILMVFSWLLKKEIHERFEAGFGKEYIMMALATLVLFSILTDILPMLWPILFFMPLWTIYIMFKGVRFFKFPQSGEMRFYIYAVLLVIGMPLLIDWGLNALIPY